MKKNPSNKVADKRLHRNLEQVKMYANVLASFGIDVVVLYGAVLYTILHQFSEFRLSWSE